MTLAELQQVVNAVEPAALLVRPRILRRVIARDRDLPYIGWHIPHRDCYVIQRDRLLAIVEADELDLPPSVVLPETVILLPQPETDLLANTAPSIVLLRYWRLVFHARVHVTLEQRSQDGSLAEADIRSRLARLGPAESEEIAHMLRQENVLLPPADDRAIYIEFAACYLDLRHFAPALLAIFFPGIHDPAVVDQLLAADIDAEALVRATRLAGAADPLPTLEESDGGSSTQTQQQTAATTVPLDSSLRDKARDVAQKGNSVRAALLHLRSGTKTGPEAVRQAEAAAHAEIDRLVDRLQAALEFPFAEKETWRLRLRSLLALAAVGFGWSVPARLLYDLQKICIAHERPPIKLDLVEWALALGAVPIKRPLPGQELVLALKWLRKGLGRLPSAGLPGADRAGLAELLRGAVEHTAHRLRERFRPLLRETLEEVGLQPQNLPEQVARAKLIEEGLDRVIEMGLLTMGGLRDALSRNQLKLPDLDGVKEFFGGDPLIRANRRLAIRLDGIYHRGEFYLCWLQRLSSAAFGTRPGRFLTQYIALPFGSAFVILKGAEEIVELVGKVVGTRSAPPADLELATTHVHHHHPHLLNEYSFFALGFFLLAVLHLPAFRAAIGNVLAAVWRALAWVGIDLPTALGNLPIVKALFASRPFQVGKQYVLKPLGIAVPLSLLFPLLGASTALSASAGAVLFIAAAVLINTRLGRRLEEVVSDRLLVAWEHVNADILPNLARLIVAMFKSAMEGFERLLYTVDQWLRFRQGDSKFSLVAKLVLGVGWFFLTYVIRIFINLFLEPTFNPIKHFPVVTVAAKLLVPAIPTLLGLIITLLGPVLGKAGAGVIAGFVIFFIPGLAGFLVWEFKENWRLYRANRAQTLRPVLVGHHGETIRRLLRPGFHSGTIPRLYAKLRQTGRTQRWRAFRKQHDLLEHVEEAVRYFVEREFVHLLRASRHWQDKKLEVGGIQLSTNTIRIELVAPDPVPASAWLEFRLQAGLLRAALTEPGWAAALDCEARQAFDLALAGLYKRAAVDGGAEIVWSAWVKRWTV